MNSTAFNALLDSFRQAANQPGLASQSLPTGRTSFCLTIQDVDVQVSHAGDAFAYVFIDTDLGAHDPYDSTLAAELAEANAWLLTHEHGAVICKRPVTRDYVIRTTLALDHAASGAALLRRLQSQADAVASIRRHLAAAPAPEIPRPMRADFA